MGSLTTKKTIRLFFNNGKVEQFEDELVEELKLHIHIDDEEYAEVIVSFSLLEEFVLGFLFTRGMINKYDDINTLEISNGLVSVKRKQASDKSLPPSSLIESTGSSNIDTKELFNLVPGYLESDFTIKSEVLFRGVNLLSEMPVYKKTGGTHCAILMSSDGDPIVSAEDIGRHNAVDKCIGGGLKGNADFGKCWIAVSGRLPSDMVFKAAISGIPLVASVSAATSGGVEMAEKAGITLVGFTRGNKFNCYCHSERIV